MKTEQKKEFIIKIIYFSLILVIAYLITKYFLGVLFPFVLGFVIAFALRPAIKWLHRTIKINNKVLALIVLLLFYSLIGTGLFFALLKAFTMLRDLFEDLPRLYASDLQPLINQFTAWTTNLFYRINPEIIDVIEQFDESIVEQVGNIVRGFSSGAINLLTSMAKTLPSFLLSFFFTIISSFIIALDYDKITGFLNYQVTDKNRQLFSAIKQNGVDVALNFFKAYGILLSITFVESAIGLTIMGYKNALGISLIIAIVDIFPILGTGTILVPWAIIEFFNGNLPDAIGLAILYGVITVIRRILEPRVVGDSIGLHPLITLIAMFLGVKYFGAIGLLGLPIVITIIVKLHQDGIIHIWRDPKQVKKI